MGNIKNIPEIRFPEFTAELERKRLGEIIYKTDKKNKENLDLPVYSINNTEGFLPQAEQFEGRNSNDRGFDISLYKIINKNTFAYNPARINVGSIGYSYDLDNILVSSLYVCFKTKETIDDTFLLHFLKTFSFKTSILRYEEGGVRKYLFFDNISKIPIFLPSIEEQKRIASFLSVCDKRLAQLKEKKALLEEYKKGMMQRIFSQELRFKDENGNQFSNWTKMKLVRGIDFLAGYAFDSSFMRNDLSNYQIIKMSNVYKNELRLDRSPSFWEQLEPQLEKFILKKGDTVLTLTGTVRKRDYGYSVVIDKSDRYILNQRLVRLRAIDNISQATFLKYLVASDSFLHHFFRIAKGGTGNQANVSIEELKEIRINFPEMKEQTKIANFLSGIDHKINICQSKIEQTQQYKKSLLQKMFCV
ncbi:MAG: hypothetical protein GQ564_13245 [Bacteroidales bacterium]|nr:hypothetical protein [Bacteroidales bacterium]